MDVMIEKRMDDMPDIKEITLSNGLRLITINKDSQIMALNLGFRVGAMMDPPDKKGLSHFLEHMLFTGTKNRSHDAINEDFEFLGGDVNAYTDLSQLNLSASALTGEMERAMELLADLVINSRFEAVEMERERHVILSEYKEGLEDLETVAYDLLYAKGWPEEPLKFDVIGDEDTISSVTLEDLTAHRDRYLRPANAVLTVVSSLSHEAMRQLTLTYFEAWAGAAAPTPEFLNSPNQPGIWETATDTSEMATVTMLYHFPDLDPSMETALKVLNRRLGDSDNSLLFREIRLKRGLSYDVYSSLDLTPHVRTLEIYCATEAENAAQVLDIIQGIIREITSGELPFQTKDLELSIKMHKTQSAALLDDPHALSSYICANALDQLPLLYYEKELEEMTRLGIEDLGSVARMIFKAPTISMLLPHEESEDAEDPFTEDGSSADSDEIA